MFYSQFILAKKGPLGTIWIAAHLERKLRKNQVADTDIGDSVDSILSPDVPIALRLSSHLLLGVVRIYSRKVNYLFHDCSEALLKIKQAFRSTVVDLPPEESTAPYHSITLPETFDLDDFELPDSALQGNYIDHHVGTREQITLQDSVDGTSYTALQFGLDERFGDGDSSQIRLVLDEDLFMHNITSPQHASVQLGTEEGVIHVGQSSNAPTNMDIDGGENGSDGHMNLNVLNLSEVLSNDCDKHDLSSAEKLRMSGDSSRHGYNIQTPDLNQVFSPDDHIGGPSAFPDYQAFTPAGIASPNLFDHAQAPATPGLLEEAVRANVQEIPASSPQEKNLSPTVMDVINTDNSVSPRLEVVAPAAVNTFGLENGVTMEPEPEDAAHSISSLGPNLTEAKPVSLAPECSDGVLALPGEAHLECGQNNGDHLQSEFIYRTKPVSPVSECLGGFLAATDAIHLECEQKKNDQIHSGFVCNEVSNMPIMPDGVEALCPEVVHLDDLVTSSHPIQASKVDMSLNKSTTDEIVVASHDNVWVPGVSSEINTASLWNKADPSFLANQEHAGDVNCCLTSTTPTLGSDLYLRACNSQKNLDNISPSEAGTINDADLLILDNQSHVKNADSCFIGNAPALSSDLDLLPCNLSLNQVNLLSAQDTPGFARSVLTCTSETPSIEQPLHVSGSSLNLQGEDNHTINITNTIQEIYQKSDSVLSNILSHAFEPDGQLTSAFSKETQPVNLNFSSSGYPEPEKVLFATNCDVNLPNDLGQVTTEKGVSESTESINQNNSLTGKKHHLMDCSPLLQHSNPVKKSRLPRLKRSATYMPNDDDLLASILVGRTPTLRMGPTPVSQKAAQQKRPRLTPRVGVPKRKVLLDDTMVLHADAIRKQLVSIEDIRRMRKKAPCTRPEIWMIQKNAMEEELFSESLFTGISTELNNLNTKTYDMNENKSSQIVDHHLDEFDLYVQQSKEKERSRMESVSRNNGKETGDPAGAMSDRLDSGMQRPSDTSVSILAHNGIEADVPDAHKKMEPHMSQLEPSISISAHNGIEHVPDAHKKIEPHMSQLEPSISIPAHNGIEADVPDAHKKIEPHMSHLEPSINDQTITVSTTDFQGRVGVEMPLICASHSVNEIEVSTISNIEEFVHKNTEVTSISIPAHNDIGADVPDAHKKIEPHMSQLEPCINDQTITVSTTDVQGRVGVEMPLICASHSVNEIEVSTISNIEEFVHKNTEVTTILQEQELRLDLVQSSVRPIEINDRTSSFAGTAVGDAASAEDEIRCRIVDGGMQKPPVASASIVADTPLVCSPLSGREIGISTLSTSEKEALNIPQESKLVDDSARLSDKSMEMVDRTPNFGGATIDGVVSSEYADRDNSVTVRVGECSIPEDASISQNKSRMDVLDSNGPQYIHDVGEIENGEILVSMLDRCLLEDRAGMAADSSNVVEHANIIPDAEHMVEKMLVDVERLIPDAAAEHMVEKMLVDVERPTSEVSCSENAQSVSSCLHQQNTETENVPSAVGDNSGLLECIIEGSLDVESARMDGGAARESTDRYDRFDNNDTEFLNADYEPDFDAAEDNGMPDTEASLENSGWSTRTRGVARYLKTLFNEEHGRGRKTIAVDHLLAGKTRKEASRMFFETLVLRTRDYIHVEQEIPFERINIKPGPKLLKSQF